MEQGLKDYFAALCDSFWEDDHNPKIKREFGYHEFDGSQDFDWFLNHLCRKYQPELFDLNLSASFYKFYETLVEDEHDMLDFIGTLPLSYHKIIIENCYDAFEALTVIVKALENDWSKIELINYFSISRN